MMAVMRKRQGEETSVGTHSGYISDRGERFPGSGAAPVMSNTGGNTTGGAQQHRIGGAVNGPSMLDGAIKIRTNHTASLSFHLMDGGRLQPASSNNQGTS